MDSSARLSAGRRLNEEGFGERRNSPEAETIITFTKQLQPTRKTGLSLQAPGLTARTSHGGPLAWTRAAGVGHAPLRLA
jgi:hypothetical protein